MSEVLIAVPAVPLLAALAVVALRPSAPSAARLSVGVSGTAFVAAVAGMIVVAIDEPLSAVVTDSNGQTLFGLGADRVGAVLLVLTTAVALVVQSFASRSLRGDDRARRFHVLAMVLTATTSMVAVSATASGLVVAWIATSVALVALVGHRSPWAPAVSAQRRTGWSFLIGDAALAVAVLVAIVLTGDIDMRAVGDSTAALADEQVGPLGALSVVTVLLVVAGVARSALVPIHRWLPTTLAAPTPVSALLHAGVVNGAGVLLIRFSPLLGVSVPAMTLAFTVGLLTAFVATAVMLVRTDVKGALVWSTSGQMGFMVLQLGVGAFSAALFHIVGHALYKAAMFLGAGGAITTHARHAQRPHLGRSGAATLASIPVRVVLGLIVPLVAFGLAFLVVHPHLTSAAAILVVAFGSLSVGRAVNGWLSATPFAPGPSVAMASVGVVIAAFAYVGGISLFESFVAGVVPDDVPAAVGPIWTAVALGLVAVAVAAVGWTPGPRGDALRRRTYAWLVSTGTPTRATPIPLRPAVEIGAVAPTAPVVAVTSPKRTSGNVAAPITADTTIHTTIHTRSLPTGGRS